MNMRIADYATLDYLYRVLVTKKITPVIIGAFILFLFTPFFVFQVLSVFVFLFTFYMLFVLYKNDRIGWIIGFFIWMSISMIPVWFLNSSNLLSNVFQYTPLLFFFFYCMALREKIGEWLMETEFTRKERVENLKYESDRNKTRR